MIYRTFCGFSYVSLKTLCSKLEAIEEKKIRYIVRNQVPDTIKEKIFWRNVMRVYEQLQALSSVRFASIRGMALRGSCGRQLKRIDNFRSGMSRFMIFRSLFWGLYVLASTLYS